VKSESLALWLFASVPDAFHEAMLELLAEKGILTGEEVLERIKKLKSESPVQFRWMQ
jgi:hypothetical protein